MSNLSVRKVVQDLRESQEDFEWYPTTDNMISVVAQKIKSIYENENFSMMDIGAGDGRIFEVMDEILPKERGYIHSKFAIEKSQKLISLMPRDVIIIGTDFLQQSLLDKKADVIFCNPPYSEYEQWFSKIISESNVQNAFLIIPQRWTQNESLKKLIKKRNCITKVLFSGDFLDADRSARAKIDIVHLYFGSRYEKNDPFDAWFDDHFKINTDPKEVSSYKIKEEKQKEIKELVIGRNPVQALSELYQRDMEKLICNLKAVCALDRDILRELNVSLDGLKGGMKEKISGLKGLYWKELFDNMSQITDRLTSKTRESFVEKFNDNVSVDFSESNAYAIIIWAIKNANFYIDEQLLSVYRDMTSEENAVPYKSNTHMTKDTWRYLRNWDNSRTKPSHYSLDYRIVLNHYRAIYSGSDFSYGYLNNLHESAHDYINDIFTVAKNLGFNVQDSSKNRHWVSNQEQKFYLANGDLFACVRCFKNGNIHFKLCQKFMKAFNVEAGRLLGWIKSPNDAVEEMGIDQASANAVFGKTFKFNGQNLIGYMSTGEEE